MQKLQTEGYSVEEVDAVGAIASTRKLLDLVERKHVSLVIFGHDGPQWSTLKQLPDFFD